MRSKSNIHWHNNNLKNYGSLDFFVHDCVWGSLTIRSLQNLRCVNKKLLDVCVRIQNTVLDIIQFDWNNWNVFKSQHRPTFQAVLCKQTAYDSILIVQKWLWMISLCTQQFSLLHSTPRVVYLGLNATPLSRKLNYPNFCKNDGTFAIHLGMGFVSRLSRRRAPFINLTTCFKLGCFHTGLMATKYIFAG